jgi:uncharacterized membrane-anchored protein
MRAVITVLQNVLVWIKFAQGTIQMIPGDAGWKDDFMQMTGVVVNEITIFLQTHPVEPSTVAKGYAATVKFCDSVLAKLDLLVLSTAPKDERLAQAKDLADDLSDPSKVYQAKKGDDADALKGAKAAAQRRLDTIAGQ